jgi:hypothetical protein
MGAHPQVKPRDVGTGLPSHVGGEVVVTYGGIPTPVDGRVKAIILALLRDAHGMGVDQETVSLVQFKLDDAQQGVWCRLEVLHGKSLKVP